VHTNNRTFLVHTSVSYIFAFDNVVYLSRAVYISERSST